MVLPIRPPLSPMLARVTEQVPRGDGWLYEPKWDGFRALAFCDDGRVELQSRDLRSLNRYFPELESGIAVALDGRSCVLDGEVVVAVDGVLDFESVLLRVHPAATRVRQLAREIPAGFVAWDLLALDDEDLRGRPLRERRALLEALLEDAPAPLHLSPATTLRDIACNWFSDFEGAGLDGVVSKRLDGIYLPGERAMVKTKHTRTADCVVAALRWSGGQPSAGVRSLQLGLYDDDGLLQYVGACTAFAGMDRRALGKALSPLILGDDEPHPWRAGNGVALAPAQRIPTASKWRERDDETWVPLRLQVVAEVAYDHLQGPRFRHATQLVRWRPDKSPDDCRYDQLDTAVPGALDEVFATATRATRRPSKKKAAASTSRKKQQQRTAKKKATPKKAASTQPAQKASKTPLKRT